VKEGGNELGHGTVSQRGGVLVMADPGEGDEGDERGRVWGTRGERPGTGEQSTHRLKRVTVRDKQRLIIWTGKRISPPINGSSRRVGHCEADGSKSGRRKKNAAKARTWGVRQKSNRERGESQWEKAATTGIFLSPSICIIGN